MTHGGGSKDSSANLRTTRSSCPCLSSFYSSPFPVLYLALALAQCQQDGQTSGGDGGSGGAVHGPGGASMAKLRLDVVAGGHLALAAATLTRLEPIGVGRAAREEAGAGGAGRAQAEHDLRRVLELLSDGGQAAVVVP